MTLFADKLIDEIKAKKSVVCVGLDPRLEGKAAIPAFLQEKCGKDANESIWEFNKAIIEETCPYTAIYKPQIAFYEQYDAMDALKKTIQFIHEKGSLVILDAKRNDIGPTAEAYAIAAFERLQADAITVNSYLGIDGVAPFMKYIPQGKGVFLLIKTSNPSSGEFQDLFSIAAPNVDAKETIFQTSLTNNTLCLERNFIQMARLMKKWGEDAKLSGTTDVHGIHGYSSIGGVVGATYPEQLSAVRAIAPKNFILIPGYGAQGGTAKDIKVGINPDGLGAIVNASRSINFAYLEKSYSASYSEEQFAGAAGHAAKDMRDAINNCL
jgi:orotidine-5'-phosphate decarboxylase